MDYFLVVLPIILILSLITYFIIIMKRRTDSKSKDNLDAAHVTPVSFKRLESKRIQESGIVIPIKRLPATTEIDEKSLFEITDRTVIARISETIPAAAEAAAKTITDKALKNIELYKAVIPNGTTLTKSKQMEGAVRGLFHGKNGIKGHANLVKVDPNKVSKAASVASGVANVMNVCSLVVGQYYMSEISSKLEIMTKSIDKIAGFQEREFKSRILSLLARVGEISQFSSEIMENSELRIIKLATLEDLKGITTELLGQVNLTITDIYHKNPNPVYKEYQEKVDELIIMVEYHNVLVAALEEVCKLSYLLGKGGISCDMCYTLFNKYSEQSVQTINQLEQWHDKQIKLLGIDLDKNRISKSGVEGFFSGIAAYLVDDKWKYRELKQGLVQKINTQSNKKMITIAEPEAVYEKDVQIIIKDGKYYFLHESPTVGEK